ncbi:MAG: lamin tail domain-containing protein [Tannerella sp.]|nr:lamin tail domain-containing protein [Tannerella sp.]
MNRLFVLFAILLFPAGLAARLNEASVGDVLINEVMANPVGLTAFPETEYVELYNASGDAVSLSGWSFVYDGKATALPDSLLPAGSYAVLFRSGREIYVEDNGIAIPVAAFPSSLANTGKTVQLINSTGIVIDFVSYATAQAGCSWERDESGNWYLSNDTRGGTPGAVNSPKDTPPPVIPVPDLSQPGDVLINEVMANPVGLTAFPETEYVELYNASGNTVSLSGWSFVYDGKATALPDSLLPAGSYAVLFRSGREVYVENYGLAVPVAAFPSSLANTGKTLQLINSTGIVIDFGSYATAQAGCSWERDESGNWYLSNDTRGGTPGAVNSPKDTPPPVIPVPDLSQPGDVLINEVMANPVGLTAFPETEYVEIFNVSGNTVSLSGWSFIYDGKATALPDSLLPAGSYAVLFRSGREIYVADNGIAIPVAAFPSSLANTGKTLQLINSTGIVIDSVSYATAQAGCSWERDESGNWYLSNDTRGGTPGAVNSPKDTPPPVIPVPDLSQPGDVLINEVMANPVGLTAFPETEYVEIYNVSGNTISLSGWSFVYDGKATALPDSLLPTGSYAVLFRSGREIYVADNGLAIPVAAFPSSLANTGKALQLVNSSGIIIDSGSYATAQAGCSWERDESGNWYLSNDTRGGTPGAANSSKDTPPPVIPVPDLSQSGDVLINEVMANPVGLTAFPETEYVELYNASGNTISLSGWSFIYDGKATALPDNLLPAGSYAVLFRSGREIHVADNGLAIPVATFPSSLANTGKALQLVNSSGIIIDSVSYATAQAGCSWERDESGNWYLSNDTRGGTPGAVNSPEDTPPPVIPVPDLSQPGDVLINEIMANPVGLTAFPETEYVELYNVSGNTISLSGWSFIYDGKATALPDNLLPAGSYAVLFRSGREIYVADNGLAIPVATFPSSLANTGKALQLVNSSGIIIDSVSYATAKAGCSWERDESGNWYLSNDTRGGTPGAVNSPKDTPPPVIPVPDLSQPGDVLINEVMANPVGLTAFPETEYVELYNASGNTISLSGWSFIYDGKATALPDSLLPAGSYAVLFRSGREIYVADNGLAVPVAAFPSSLANTGKTLQLINSTGIIIDSVSYATAKAGCSWERDDDDNWYLSIDTRGGTPGAINSPKDTPPPVLPVPDLSQPGDVLINEVMANPVGLTAFPETEYVELYNASDNTISLSGWSFIYDGKATALPDSLLPSGGYAVLFRSGREIYVADNGLAVPVATFPSSLANTGKALQLVNSEGIVIDSISYATAKAGCSWERDDDDNWYLSIDTRGGTPGAVNSSRDTPPPVIPVPDLSQPGDVLINEVMANPVGLMAFPETEYVELYNASDNTISLSGWSFIYDGKTTVLPDSLLPAGSYAVLFRSGREIYVEDNGIAIPVATFPSSLANAGKALQLVNSAGIVIDFMDYAEAQPARSWERDESGNWYLSNNVYGGTPGAVNSPKIIPNRPDENDPFPTDDRIIYERDIIFNEILPEPSFGGSEYIELYNRSGRPVRLIGLSIATRKADGELRTRYTLASVTAPLPPEAYLVLTSNRGGVLNFYFTSSPEAIHELKLPELSNTGATLVLCRTNDDAVIDEVGYSDKWHDAAIKNAKGVSLERRYPESETQNASNWTSATSAVGYGTPGDINSQRGVSGAAHAVSVNTPEYVSGFDEYVITYRMDKAGYHLKMEIFTPEGRKVAEISNNQLSGPEGEIRWNGYGLDGNRLPPAVYIFQAACFHPDGQKKTVRKAFLVKP